MLVSTTHVEKRRRRSGDFIAEAHACSEGLYKSLRINLGKSFPQPSAAEKVRYA